MKNTLRISFAVVVFALTSSCERMKSDSAKLVIQLPNASVSSKSEFQTNTFTPGLSIANLSEVNCYAVFVGGKEEGMRNSFCKNGATEKFRFGPSRFFVPAGQEISLDVPAGADREIILVGTKAQGTACRPIGPGQNVDETNMAALHILGRKTMNLFAGANKVDLPVSLVTSETFDDCNFAGGGGGGSNSGAATQVHVTKDFFPKQGLLIGTCQAFYLSLLDNNLSGATSNQNVVVNVSDGSTNWSMYDNCTCSGGPSVYCRVKSKWDAFICVVVRP